MVDNKQTQYKNSLKFAQILLAIFTPSLSDSKSYNIKHCKILSDNGFDDLLIRLNNMVLPKYKKNVHSPTVDLLATFMQIYLEDDLIDEKILLRKNFINYCLLIHKSICSFSQALQRKFDKFERLDTKTADLIKQYIYLTLNCHHVYILDKYKDEYVIVKLGTYTKNFKFSFDKIKYYDIDFNNNALNIRYKECLKELEGFDKLRKKKDEHYTSIEKFINQKSINDFDKLYKRLDKIIDDEICPYCNYDVKLANDFDETTFNIANNYKTEKRPKSCNECKLIFENFAILKPDYSLSSNNLPKDKLKYSKLKSLKNKLGKLRIDLCDNNTPYWKIKQKIGQTILEDVNLIKLCHKNSESIRLCKAYKAVEYYFDFKLSEKADYFYKKYDYLY